MPSSLSSPRARFGVAFSLLARRWRRTLDTQLADAGLSDATWVPLIHLRESGDGITQKTLAERVGVDASSLVRVLDILSRQGLIERRATEEDGRARLVHLTPAGRRRVEKIRHELWKVEENLLADLSEEDVADMLAQFDKIDRRLSRREGGRQPEADT